MKILPFAVMAGAAALLAACNQSPAEQQAEVAADNVEANAEMQADQLENQADAVRETDPGLNSAPVEQRADQLEDQADVVRESGDRQAEAIKDGARN